MYTQCECILLIRNLKLAWICQEWGIDMLPVLSFNHERGYLAVKLFPCFMQGELQCMEGIRAGIRIRIRGAAYTGALPLLLCPVSS